VIAQWLIEFDAKTSLFRKIIMDGRPFFSCPFYCTKKCVPSGRCGLNFTALCLISVYLLFFPLHLSGAFSEDRITGSKNDTIYQITISVGERKLRLYRRHEAEGLTFIREYDVATAMKGLKPQPMGPGRITKIEFNPKWYPPPVTRATFKEKGINLPPVVPPGHPLNFMGAFKMHISHCTSRGCFYRIHGNNDKSKIGKRVTGGCVRMYNEEGVALARLIPIGTKVLIVP